MAGKTVEALNGYKIEWIDRQRLQDLARHLLAQRLDGVGINPYNRWDGKPADVELLPDDLRALAVPFADEVGVTQERLQRLPRLEFLLLAEYTGAADIGGDSFRIVRVQLTRKIRLSGMPNLRLFYVRGFDKWLPMSKWPSLPVLAQLEINQGNATNLAGVDRFRNLEEAELYHLRSLSSIQGLERPPRLRKLRIESCRKVKDIGEVVGQLRSLKVLHLIDCGTLPDLEFIRGLQLRELRFGRTVIGNGDLSPIDAIPVVAFDEHNHYNREPRESLA